MITVSVLYPNQKGAKFDMSYYLEKHIPMVQKLLGNALKGVVVEQGIGGGTPGSEATYAVVCHLRFDSAEAFQKAFAAHAATVQADMSNYASAAPIIQLSEVKLS